MADLSNVFDLLVRLQIELWNAVDARLRSELGVTLGTLECLRIVSQHGACRVNDIADDLVITVGGASKLVDRVEASGFCRRGANPDDRRSSLIELTAKGRETLATATAVLEAELAAWFGPLTAQAIDSLSETLVSLRAAAPQLTKERK